VCLA